MNKDFQVRSTVILLALLTTAAIIYAGYNFQAERSFQLPTDGVWWVEQGGSLVANRVDEGGPGTRAGIKVGDQLTAIDEHPATTTAALSHQLFRVGAWSKTTYSLVRQAVPVDVVLIPVPAERSQYNWLRLIGLIYLGVGLYVLLRRWTALGLHALLYFLPGFVHFLYLPLQREAQPVRLDDLLGKCGRLDVAAGPVPAFCSDFSGTAPIRARASLGACRQSMYPVRLLLSLHVAAFQLLRASEVLRWNLDRLQMAYLAVFFIAAAVVLVNTYRRAGTPILRQQLKWITRGTILAITPFTLFYVIPYLAGTLPENTMKVSVLSLGLLPLTFGYAIFRYRLMDVDLIFKRGMVYTLSAAAIIGAYFAVVAAVAEVVHARVPSSGPIGLVLAIVVTALVFDPVRKWIQERIDQFFYRTRYDYRKTLIEFGRELSAETDLDEMLSSVVDRLSRTLLVDRMAVFLSGGEGPVRFLLSKSFGMTQTSGLDLSFLAAPRPEIGAGHIFFDNTHQVPRETPERAADHRAAGFELLHPLPRPEADSRRAGSGKDGGRRLPFQ